MQFNDWLRQKKAAKTRLTITIESSKSEFSREEASAMSNMYVALIRAKVKIMNETAIKMQTECNFIFTEIIVMIEGFGSRESGEQWNDQW